MLAALFFEHAAAADDDVLAFDVDLDDFGFDFFAEVITDVIGATQVDLRSGEEDRNADIDEQAAFDLAQDGALDAFAFGFVGEDILPAEFEVCLTLGEDEVAVGFDVGDHDLHFTTDIHVFAGNSSIPM